MLEQGRIDELKREWEEEVLNEALEKHPERMRLFCTASGTPVERVYLPRHVDDDYIHRIGFPGAYPFTRGIQPTMYRGRLWTMRQYAGFGTAEESNRRYRYLLEQGQTGLSVAFDLPTQIGYDSDHPLCLGEVGKVGVAIDTLEDMEVLFDGIDLGSVSTSMTINAPAAVLLAMYLAVAEKQGVDKNRLRGTIQNDILKEYIARGTYIFPPKPSMRLITDIFSYCSAVLPLWNSISISGYHIREAGSSAVQEVAFTLADGIEYVEAALQAGLNVDDFGGQLSFFFNAHNDLFEEAAKFRAARRVWARLMKERFGARKDRSMMMRFHTQTGGSTLTAQQPDNNIVRVAIQALAAVLGGTQSLHTNSRDEALSLPSEESVRIALRTQQILANESGVTSTVDPLAGSYFVESLTDEIEEGVWAYLETIEKIGGMVKAIENGYVQKEIQDTAYRYQQEVEQGEQVIVGMNRYVSEEETPEELQNFGASRSVESRRNFPTGISVGRLGSHQGDASLHEAQVAKLEGVRSGRDRKAVSRALDGLRAGARDRNINLMPFILEAVRAYASLGEICGVLRDEFGEYRESVVL
jgi:methylmalonyl-CoA mutase N-terminal domain/subunit